MKALRKSKNTSPGHDGVLYQHMEIDDKGTQTVLMDVNAILQRSEVRQDLVTYDNYLNLGKILLHRYIVTG